MSLMTVLYLSFYYQDIRLDLRNKILIILLTSDEHTDNDILCDDGVC